MALSVSVCPGQPMCWVLDTQAGLDPTPTLKAHSRPGSLQVHSTVVGPLHEGQAFWRKESFATFSRVDKTLTQLREDISGKGNQ